MNPFELYLILKLDALAALFAGSAIASGALVLVGFIGAAVWRSDANFHDDYNPKKAEKDRGVSLVFVGVARKAAVALIITTIIATLTPTTKQVAAIYVLSALTQDETVETIKSESGELYELFKAWLRSEIGEEVPAAAGGEETPND